MVLGFANDDRTPIEKQNRKGFDSAAWGEVDEDNLVGTPKPEPRHSQSQSMHIHGGQCTLRQDALTSFLVSGVCDVHEERQSRYSGHRPPDCSRLPHQDLLHHLKIAIGCSMVTCTMQGREGMFDLGPRELNDNGNCLENKLGSICEMPLQLKVTSKPHASNIVII